MGLVGRIVRPAIEQAVRLVRDSSDWNPPLKSAAGGVTCILEQARLCEDNVKSAAALLNRIGEIAHELQNHSLADVVVGPQVTRLERLLVRIATRLEPLRNRWPLTAYARAQRDAVLILGCTCELDSLICDIQLALSLNMRRDVQEVLAAVRERPLHVAVTTPPVTCPGPLVVTAVPPIAVAVSATSPVSSSSLVSEAATPAAKRLPLFNLGGYLILKRSAKTGRLQVKADIAVLFLWEVSKGVLTARK